MATGTLTESNAILLVRKNLDEVGPNNSVMYGTTQDETSDNNSIDDIIGKNIPEAINAVRLAAPVHLLEGTDIAQSSMVGLSATAPADDNTVKVLTFSLPSGSGYLRLVAFQAADSDIVVTDAIPQASPEGRKQANKYIRGRYDRPRLVLMQGVKHVSGSPGYDTLEFKYYSLKSATATTYISRFSYIKELVYDASSHASYSIEPRLRQNIIDWLTAKVLETYSDQRAQSYYQRALTFNR